MRVIPSDLARVALVIAIAAVATSCDDTRTSAPNPSGAQAARGSILVASDRGLYRRFPDGKLKRLTTGTRDNSPSGRDTVPRSHSSGATSLTSTAASCLL
jgi:hypothetical protein